MTNPVTPNIGLNKIDRTSPSTTYFDLEKYIDQNADAVDRFAGKTSESIDALKKRLDTEERREVVLQPGLQVVNAEWSAPFKLSGIKGRTLVNLAGRKTFRTVSNPESITMSVPIGSTGANTETINADVTNTDEGYIVYYQGAGSPFKALAGRYYVISADVKINSISGSGQVKVGGGNSMGAFDVDKAKIGVWQRVYHSFAQTVDKDFDIIAGVCYADGVFATVNFDIKNVSFYEVSKSEYNRVPSLSSEQRGIKWPYVDSIQPVQNPYVIRYGENLAPTLFEGTLESSTKVLSKYSAIVRAKGSTVVEYRSELIPAIPNTNYTLRAKITLNGLEKYDGVYVDVLGHDEAGLYVLDTPGTTVSGTGTGIDTFATPANIKTLEVRIVAPQDAAVGDYVVEDIMLNLGATLKRHKPREDNILALQTDLYSDPVTGENADEIFEKDGHHFILAKWKKAVLDGSLTYTLNQNRVGYKVIGVTWTFPPAVKNSAIATKYNGSVLSTVTAGSSDSTADQIFMDTAVLAITISNADSGWGNNYSPTADEIKAYFMGWTMYNGSAGGSATPDNPANNVYNSTGTKAWAYRADGVTRSWLGWSGTLPTTLAPNWTPYQLVYQLATPTVEPIVSEGMLTFNEGDNQIEVGTGIVVRESTKPVNAGDGTFWINGRTSPSYPLSNKASSIKSIYKNNLPDNAWMVRPVDVGYENVYGLVQGRLGVGLFDPSASYSVTYLMQDKSPIVPINGSYAANEKAMFQELTDAVQQNATAVSVLMNKKADKDQSVVWITPTLINGWQGVSGSAPIRFTKVNGIVYIVGRITGGAVGISTPAFILPEGFRPSGLMYATINDGTTNSRYIGIVESGNVWFENAPSGGANFDTVVFPAGK